MKVFVSGQLNDKEKIQDIYSKLEVIGFEVTHDWTRTDNIKDKLADPDESGKRAAKDITGVVDSDIYILFSDNENPGKGMYVELGAALALNEKYGKPDVYIIGKLNHLSIFYLHPKVQHLRDIDELIIKLRENN